MKTKKLLVELVECVSLFESENPHLERYDLQGFMAFLQSRSVTGKQEHLPHTTDTETMADLHENPANILSRLIGLICHMREYTKRHWREVLANRAFPFSSSC